MITPPIDVPWPPMNFVAECTTMSAPCRSGWMRYGLASVLSITSGMPLSCAIFDDGLEVEDVALRVADALSVERLRVRADRGLPRGEIVGTSTKLTSMPELRERVVQLVVGAAVERRARHDVPAVLGEVQQRDRLGGLPARDGQRADATFERDHALLERVLGRVHDARVDVAELGEPEQRGRVIGVAEHERRRLVDRRDPCAGRVRLGTCVHLTGLESPVGHGCLLTNMSVPERYGPNPDRSSRDLGSSILLRCDFRSCGLRASRRCARARSGPGPDAIIGVYEYGDPNGRPLFALHGTPSCGAASTGPTAGKRARAARSSRPIARASALGCGSDDVGRRLRGGARSPRRRALDRPIPAARLLRRWTVRARRSRTGSPTASSRPPSCRARARSVRGRRGRTWPRSDRQLTWASLHTPAIAQVALRVADLGARFAPRIALWSAETEMSKSDRQVMRHLGSHEALALFTQALTGSAAGAVARLRVAGAAVERAAR